MQKDQEVIKKAQVAKKKKQQINGTHSLQL
jgi:hypothetical protein